MTDWPIPALLALTLACAATCAWMVARAISANYRRSRMQDPEFRERQKEYNRLYQQRQRAAKAAS